VTISVNPADIMLSEISETQKNKYHPILFICEIEKTARERSDRSRVEW
jgi:hypothetical protein